MHSTSEGKDTQSKVEAGDLRGKRACLRGMSDEIECRPGDPCTDRSDNGEAQGSDLRSKSMRKDDEMTISGVAFKLTQKPRSLRGNGVKKRTWGWIDVWKSFDSKASKNSVADRTTRQSRKRTRREVASDGDMEWEAVTGESGDANRKKPLRCKTWGGLSLSVEELNGEIAAVTVGLQADMPSPSERIRFKDVLKRRGGLQEYLECRNLILGLWERDVRHNLCVTDCGLSSVASLEETPRESLLRDIYDFLNYHGYINLGIISKKLKSETQTADCNFLPATANINSDYDFNEKNQKEPSGEGSLLHEKGTRIELPGDYMVLMNAVSATDPEPMDIDEKPLVNPAAFEEHIDEQKLSLPAHCADEESLLDIANRLKARNKKKRAGLLKLEKSVKADEEQSLRGGDATEEVSICKEKVEALQVEPAKCAAEVNDTHLSSKEEMALNEGIYARQKYCKEQTTESIHNQEELGRLIFPDNLIEKLPLPSVGKVETFPRVIIVGAGPAGLAAAKHLLNLNVSVTILEARKRVGGRVFTDRTVLSGPVDLGASIITGVEADVSSERRPDPTALLCRQLDLELTTLGGDCPLFDSVVGTKVPADIDEALEAEYNSLLDDTVMLVAQNGDVAMQMSLEEGLELALKRHKEQEKRASTLFRGTDSLSEKINQFEQDGHAVCMRESSESTKKSLGISPLERRVMDWHFANLEYGCAAELNRVSLPYWNQDDVYGGFAGPHCMIKGGYGTVMEALAEGLPIHFDQVVTRIEYSSKDEQIVDRGRVKVKTSSGNVFMGDAVLVTIPLGCLKLNTIDFVPSLPAWKTASIQRLGFGILNKVVMEFPVAFWDESIDFFGATAEHTESRGRCFMFWNLKRTVGAPVLSALVVGKAAIEEEKKESTESIEHALTVLRSIFGEASVPQPTGSVVTKWGSDPYSRGAYSYVAVGASGEDYDIIGRSVENCVFFAGEATCKEHPDTVGGAIMTGLREAVRIVDVLYNRVDSVAEAEAMAAAQRQSDTERNEVRDMTKRLTAAELSIAIRKDGGILDEDKEPFNKAILLQDMFGCAKTTSGRLLLAKEMLQLPASSLEAFAGTREGLTILNSWIQDSLGKDATQLLRHCVRLLLVVGKDLPSVRQSGIGRTVKEKVVVHTSRDIRAVASQLVKLWVDTFRKEKAAGKIARPLQQSPTGFRNTLTMSKVMHRNMKSGTSPMVSRDKVLHPAVVSDGSRQQVSEKESTYQSYSTELRDAEVEKEKSTAICSNSSWRELVYNPISDSEAAALAAAEAAVAAANAAAKAYETAEAASSQLELPKIVSFHKFANKREYMILPEATKRRSLERDALILHGKDQVMMGVDARNCKVRDWSIDFTDSCSYLRSPNVVLPVQDGKDGSKETELSGLSSACTDNSKVSFRIGKQLFSEQEEATVNMKEAASAGSPVKEAQEQTSGLVSELAPSCNISMGSSRNGRFFTESNIDDTARAITDARQCSREQLAVVRSTRDEARHLSRCSEHKKAVTDYVSNLLIPLYKTRKIDKDGFKSLVKKSAVKVIERQTELEAAMEVSQFLDTKRKIKIRTLVDKFVERYLENLVK
ncbi:hypothetical protein GOP47_0012104 [Adiantum capillus-veneris]|uniref:SWIRM domain-containing protein n=1 Tax=Adiantum capillus-veneris TaxID=13818 RepID=A0A9D4UQ30_ADICA|nr:hypothetical protein GOP47_0012104 [Adiantum capillus-veneris]